MDIASLAPIALAEKKIAFVPSFWTESPHKNSTSLELLLPLQIDGIVKAHTFLRCTCIKEQPDCNVTLQLEIDQPGRRLVAVERFDWRPLKQHRNKMGPRNFLFRLMDTHVHIFNDNADIGEDAFHPLGNLPVARPIEPEPQTFQEALAVCGVWLKITNAADIPDPQWEYRLGL